MLKSVLMDVDREDEIHRIVKTEYGRSCFVDKGLSKEGRTYYSIGCAIPKEIDNNREGIHRTRFISLRDIDVMSVSTLKDRMVLHYPPRDEIIEKAYALEAHLMSEAERSLLSSVSTKLVRTTNVKQGLNPIVEIITGLLEFDQIPLRSLKKQQRYIPLLIELDYIREIDNMIVPSNEFNKFHLVDSSIHSEDDEFFALLGDIAVRAYPYIKRSMRIMHLTPVLRTSNVMYFSSLLNDARLPLRVKDVFSLFKRYYGPRSFKGDIKTLGYIRELVDVGIAEKQAEYLVPSEDGWNSFVDVAPSIG